MHAILNVPKMTIFKATIIFPLYRSIKMPQSSNWKSGFYQIRNKEHDYSPTVLFCVCFLVKLEKLLQEVLLWSSMVSGKFILESNTRMLRIKETLMFIFHSY
ncbi:hypothetical protein ILYODFUR_021918 [Ilyodon furcidens]|uniref:Uncharacterized protein n=1 Tax=Ilyodon furcidens TaxID=33524 RepID=A0ABV0SQH2_9TELE